jgi:mannose-P-dolichol utilization defect protein 1
LSKNGKFQIILQTATKIIGYGLVMGGAIIKFPQIIKIISNKSVLGISFISVILEVFIHIKFISYVPIYWQVDIAFIKVIHSVFMDKMSSSELKC